MKKFVPVLLIILLFFIGCEAATSTESIIRYRVIFRNDTAIIATTEVEKGKTVYAPQIDIKEGYTLSGWQEKGVSGYFDFSTPINRDFTLYPSWEIMKYSVTFETGTDTPSIPAQTVDHGGKATKPSDPVKEGFIFAGWSLNGVSFDFSSPITGDTVLKPVWSASSFKVTFQDSATIIASYDCTADDEIRIPTPPEPAGGMRFAGWKLEGSETVLSSAMESITLSYRQNGYAYTALWTEAPATQPEKITVSFYNGKSLVLRQSYAADTENAVPDAPTAPYGYELTGWKSRTTSDFIESDQDVFSLSYIDKEYVFDAVWDEIPITVSFWNDDMLISTGEYNRNTSYPVPADPAPREGYSFEGWMDTKSGAVYNDSFTLPYSSEGYNLAVSWKRLPVTVSFYDGARLIEKRSVEPGTKQTFPELELQEGFKLLGWTKAGSTTFQTGTEFTVPESDGDIIFRAYITTHMYTIDSSGTIRPDYRYVDTKSALFLPDSINGITVTAIADKAFSGYNIKEIHFSEGIRIIGEKAFYECGLLNNVIIPSSIRTIKADAFRRCYNLKTIIILKPKYSISGAPWGGDIKYTYNEESHKDIRIIWSDAVIDY